MESTTMAQGTKGKAKLPAPLRRKLRNYVTASGEGNASAVLGVSTKTISRALAGQDVRRATATVIDLGLKSYSEDGAPAAAVPQGGGAK
jgi:hypothetical protein